MLTARMFAGVGTSFVRRDLSYSQPGGMVILVVGHRLPDTLLTLFLIGEKQKQGANVRRSKRRPPAASCGTGLGRKIQANNRSIYQMNHDCVLFREGAGWSVTGGRILRQSVSKAVNSACHFVREKQWGFLGANGFLVRKVPPA